MSANDDDDVCLSSSLAADKSRAEELLFELAVELRHVPIDEGTRALHLRALALKASIGRWSEKHSPDEHARQALCDELLALEQEARALGR